MRTYNLVLREIYEKKYGFHVNRIELTNFVLFAFLQASSMRHSWLVRNRLVSRWTIRTPTSSSMPWVRWPQRRLTTPPTFTSWTCSMPKPHRADAQWFLNTLIRYHILHCSIAFCALNFSPNSKTWLVWPEIIKLTWFHRLTRAGQSSLPTMPWTWWPPQPLTWPQWRLPSMLPPSIRTSNNSSRSTSRRWRSSSPSHTRFLRSAAWLLPTSSPRQPQRYRCFTDCFD